MLAVPDQAGDGAQEGGDGGRKGPGPEPVPRLFHNFGWVAFEIFKNYF